MADQQPPETATSGGFRKKVRLNQSADHQYYAKVWVDDGSDRVGVQFGVEHTDGKEVWYPGVILTPNMAGDLAHAIEEAADHVG